MKVKDDLEKLNWEDLLDWLKVRKIHTNLLN
jgi:hypothetical protein